MPALHEVTLQDLSSLVAVKAAPSPGIFTFKIDQISSAMYDPKESSKTIQGAGRGPRAHARTTTAPIAKLKMSRREAIRFKKFMGPDGVCALMVTTQPPDDVPVTDIVNSFKPTFGALELKGSEVTEIEITGNGLGDITWDFKGAIV